MDFGPFAVAIAFWAFVAIATVAGVVSDYKKRKLALEPLRAAIEKGQQLDPAVVERLMAPATDAGVNPLHLRIAGVIVISAAVGIAILSFFLAHIAPIAFYPVMGGALLVLCIGAGLYLASVAVYRHGDRKEVRGPGV
jgi:hypothetical protein